LTGSTIIISKKIFDTALNIKWFGIGLLYY